MECPVTGQVTGEIPKKGLIMHNVFVTEVTQYYVHGGLQQIKGSLTKNLMYNVMLIVFNQRIIVSYTEKILIKFATLLRTLWVMGFDKASFPT